MAATLIAVVVALALGHLASDLAGGLRQFAWFTQWLRWLNAQFPDGSAWRGRYGIAIALMVPLLVIGLFQVALDQPLWGLVGLLFDVAVLFYCWGPRDLDLDVAAILDAPDAATRRKAAARLWPNPESVRMDGGSLVEAVFRNALRRWFGVLFWFLVLGPFGAVLYRLSALAAAPADDAALPPETTTGARAWLAVLEWPVSQLMTLSLALVGNFDSVVGAWRDRGNASFHLHTTVLDAAARATVRSDISEAMLDEGRGDFTESGGAQATALTDAFGALPELTDAMSLVWRILVLWMAIIAMFVIAGWVS